ncbi:hypothetical protein RRG08_019442 [Elysia crispata]|uniref:Uncharacterized protein n=1 Tax=Elysia crispata TaxID=231223 RepID=A0AAE0YAY7_9GAST|nr:hypothetical protein RRG08_019442 [Elysia crispata]
MKNTFNLRKRTRPETDTKPEKMSKKRALSSSTASLVCSINEASSALWRIASHRAGREAAPPGGLHEKGYSSRQQCASFFN